jgi:glucokinase
LIASAKDPSVAIINSAVDPHMRCKLCAAAIDTFVSILASEAGNLALKVFATGGVYLAGGIPVHILSLLPDLGFMESFRRKGRFVELMERIPIHVVTARAALVGAATYGLGSFNEGSS